MQEQQVGIQPKRVSITATQSVRQQVDYRSLNLKKTEGFGLPDLLLNLDLDIVSAMMITDDVLMSMSSMSDHTTDLIEKLICVRRLLAKSLNSMRGLSALPLGESDE